MHRYYVSALLACLTLIPAPLLAAAAPDDLSLAGSDRYQRCIDLTKRNAQGAYNQALAWHSVGGGTAADHCAALALVQLGRYAEAAPKLDTLAQGAGLRPAERSQLFDQAGNMWLLAEMPQQAERSFSDSPGSLGRQ